MFSIAMVALSSHHFFWRLSCQCQINLSVEILVEPIKSAPASGEDLIVSGSGKFRLKKEETLIDELVKRGHTVNPAAV